MTIWKLGINDSLLKTAGTRESGFTYAIASAGVTWAISRACAEGNLSDCGCGFQSCDDNIKYGMQFSSKFLDVYGESVISENSSSEKKARTLMNSHNNNIGRKVRPTYFVQGTQIIVTCLKCMTCKPFNFV